MLATVLIANVLLATSALAAPRGKGSNLANRVARRAGAHQSKPLQLSEGPAAQNSNISNVEYSSNWAGAVVITSAGAYKSVTGTFIVPTPKEPSGGSSSTTYSASAWVGIDGDTCDSAILQTGVDFNVKGTSVSYDAWYEWYPDYAYDFSGISFSAGDSVTLTVTATSTKAGTAVIKNNTKGTTVTKSITSSSSLCEENFEWIVEDYEEGSSLVPLANFGTVEFTGISPSASGATLIDIEQNSKVLTSVSSTSSTVTVTYV